MEAQEDLEMRIEETQKEANLHHIEDLSYIYDNISDMPTQLAK